MAHCLLTDTRLARKFLRGLSNVFRNPSTRTLRCFAFIILVQISLISPFTTFVTCNTTNITSKLHACFHTQTHLCVNVKLLSQAQHLPSFILTLQSYMFRSVKAIIRHTYKICKRRVLGVTEKFNTDIVRSTKGWDI